MDMELSDEVHNLLEKFRTLKKRSEESINFERSISQTPNYEIIFDNNDVIRVDEIKFSDDESWLYLPESRTDTYVKDLNQWLNTNNDELKSEDFHSKQLQIVREMAKIDTQKPIDSRTFTRPKKKFTHPSIEKFNEEYFDSKVDQNPLLAAKLQELELEREVACSPKPLNFDLSQPTSTSMFDKILASAPELDSFQNMSPPSLINSMCSSTFTTLMENSFIKNDPVLREIRDTDYSETVLLQDSDPPLFQSFTGSCNSLNSDLIENFNMKNFNSTYNETIKNVSKIEEEEKAGDIMERSLENSADLEVYSANDLTSNEYFSSNETQMLDEHLDYSSPNENDNLNTTVNLTKPPNYHNGTYKKGSSKLFITPENVMNFSTDSLDEKSFHDASPKERVNRNNTFTKAKSPYTRGDSNLSYTNTNEVKRNNSSFGNNELNHTINLKRNSFGNSAGSADSLDRMSSLSDSSKGSNKMLNMEDVDAIVERQEQSLQLFSTPKAPHAIRKIVDPILISPIKSNREPFSDSELSSGEDYLTVRSSLSKVSSLVSVPDVMNTCKSPKSLSSLNINRAADSRSKKSSNTVSSSDSRPLLAARSAKGSLSNLRTVGTNLKGSYASLSNLKSVGSSLRGSFTSLRPPHPHLPVVPPLLNTTNVLSSRESDLNSTVTLETSTKANETFKVPLVPDVTKAVGDTTFAKSQSRGSSLPRPVSSSTGIPRPLSRIPGPRTIRPVASKTNLRTVRQVDENGY